MYSIILYINRANETPLKIVKAGPDSAVVNINKKRRQLLQNFAIQNSSAIFLDV